MKPINTLSIFLITILFNSIYAQNYYCATDDNLTQNISSSNSNCSVYNPSTYSASIDKNYLNSFDKVLLDLVIWGYEKTNGVQSINQDDAHNMVESLNSVYGEFNIYFNLINFDHIVSNQGYWGVDSYWDSGTNILGPDTQYDDIALQIFVPNGYPVRGQAWFDSAKSVVRKDQIDKGILHHEVGHNFGLQHSFRCERVTRDPTDSLYNADEAGDYVVDTKAAPKFYSNMDLVSDDCTTYDGNLTNCHGEEYANLTESDLKNIMTWTFCPRVTFTTGQKIRVHETLQNCSNTIFDNIINDTAEKLPSINSDEDYGIEPDNQTGAILDSSDTWVKNQPDGYSVQQHEDLEYIDDNTPVYVYVKVRNVGCDTSSGSDDLKLYWAKGGIGQQIWPDVWTGANNSFNSLNIGNQIGSQTIPAIGSISAGNFNLEQAVTSDINFFTNQGNLIWEEAEIRVRLNESLWEVWQDSGANSTDVRILNSFERIIYLNGNNYILDLSNNSKSINLSNNPSGQYIINLVTDNVIVDTKNLLKN